MEAPRRPSRMLPANPPAITTNNGLLWKSPNCSDELSRKVVSQMRKDPRIAAKRSILRPVVGKDQLVPCASKLID